MSTFPNSLLPESSPPPPNANEPGKVLNVKPDREPATGSDETTCQ